MAYEGCRVLMVVAMSRNRVIGFEGAMPWRIPADQRCFKALTLGKPVIMGRKTFDSIGRVLPDRLNIVVTRQRDWSAPDVLTAPSLEEAFRQAADHVKDAADRTIAVIGGGEIYRAALPFTDEIALTDIDADIDGDTTFPELDPEAWRRAEEWVFPEDPKASHPARFTRWERVAR